MLAATAALTLMSPVILLAAAIADLTRHRRRFPTVRLALFAMQYALNDSAEILLAPLLWLVAGCGTRLDRKASIGRHERLQAWSIAVLARRAERLLGVRLELDAATIRALTPGPVVVLCRHVNIIDSSIPTLLYQRLGYHTRGVIMAELLADPGFDLIYRRTGSVFIPRENGPEAIALLQHLREGLDESTAVVIFPEGRLFRTDLRVRFLAKIGGIDPARARRLEPLRHVLPPRPGGVLALLDAIPSADVVVIAHAGLDTFGSFLDLARAAPLTRPITVTAWRIPAKDIPHEPNARIAWLDDQWLRIDAWIDRQLASAGTIG
jgi:1-acyl-sn-glycerol-3-phosphate acyltransferase